MKTTLLVACLGILFARAICATPPITQDPSKPMGLTSVQLRSLVNSLPELPGSIQGIQFLRVDGFWINRAAFLTQDDNAGWQILIFRLEDDGKSALEWKSGKLDDSFAVSSADQFQTYRFGDEQVLKFSGCAAHNCPDVFSVMFYVPSRKISFTATYALGKLSYSLPGDTPEYRQYQRDLNRLIAERRATTH